MIGWLSGKLLAFDKDRLVVDVNGVGYQAVPTAGLLRRQVKIGENIRFFVYTHVREDQLVLFGFPDLEERRMFELLLTVSGVGPKSALAVLSKGETEEVRQAVANASVEFFTAVPGLGKKTAQRIIIDLKSKLGDRVELDLSEDERQRQRELSSALKSMGFRPEEIKGLMKDIDFSQKLEAQIRQSLKLTAGSQPERR